MERLSSQFKDSVSDEELKALEYRSFNGEIFLIDSIEKFYEVLPRLRSYSTFGFDTETKPSFKKGIVHKVSLLQLSTGSEAFLFRLNLIGLPNELAAILSDRQITKTGAAIHDDIKLLQIRRKFVQEGFVELQTMVGEFGIKDIGLKKMAAIILGFKISKRQQVTDWDSKVLTEAQILYAATDAWICYEIYRTLLQHTQLLTEKT